MTAATVRKPDAETNDLEAAREALRRQAAKRAAQAQGKPHIEAQAERFRAAVFVGELLDKLNSANESPLSDGITLEMLGAMLAAEWDTGLSMDAARSANWLNIGHALFAGREMHSGNDKAFGQWVAQHLPGMDRTTRADAIWLIECADELASVVASHPMPDNLIHPTSIRRWFRKMTKPAASPKESQGSEANDGDDKESTTGPAASCRLVEGMSMADAAAAVARVFNATGTTKSQAAEFCTALLALITKDDIGREVQA